MTDPRGRIRRSHRGGTAILASIVALGLGLALAGCNDPPPKAPLPPALLVPERAGAGLEDEPAELALGKPDPWYDAYRPYMSPETRRDYLSTPEDDRFERFGLRLLDYQLREDLLREHQDSLNRDEVEAYRRLATADDCRRFISERAASRRSDSAPVTTSATQRAPR